MTANSMPNAEHTECVCAHGLLTHKRNKYPALHHTRKHFTTKSCPLSTALHCATYPAGYFAHVDAKTKVLTCVRCPPHGALCGKTGTKFA